MEFFEDVPEEPGELDFDEWEEGFYDDSTQELVELFGMPIYDLPSIFEPAAVIVMIKGYWGDSASPSLLFRASDNLASYEIQAILADGIRQTLEMEG